jgi:formylglycine-generating enzyme required for sulfatase activity
VSDASQITCPECQTSQSAKAPFCENCGYRIRRSDTVKEGHHVVTPEVLRRAREKRPNSAGSPTGDGSANEATAAKARSSQKQSSQSRSSQSRSSQSRSSQSQSSQSQSSRPKRPGNSTPAGTDGSAEGGPRTYVEGLRAVDRGVGDTDNAAKSAEFPSPASQSSLIDRPAAADTSGKLAVYMAIWLSLTAVAVLATYFLTTRMADEDARAIGLSEIPAQVEVPEGAFLRGLEGDVRSFIIQMCQKVEDDPKETCKEKKLLKGEYPEKTVELPAFKIDSTEVTVADFKKCTDAGDCTPIDYKECDVWTHQGYQLSLRVPKALRDSNMPVTCADLAQAKAYCEWAGGELPSADQWEKAARGTKGKLFPWGTSWSSDIANWGEMDVAQNPIVGKLDGFEWTAPPASFPEGKSPYGAYDMAGNVAEWVDTGDKISANARGGSWTSHPFDLRTTHRMEIDADARRTDVGFRCAYE